MEKSFSLQATKEAEIQILYSEIVRMIPKKHHQIACYISFQ